MDFLQQPDVKKTYEKCKYIVKVWEHKFTKKHKRLPSKVFFISSFDIREANSEVRHAYRKYFQLKTAALEQSFIDVEGFDNEEDGRNDDEEDGSNKNKESTHTVLNEMNQNSSPLEEKSMHDNVSLVQTIEIPKEIWGIHLNKKDEESKPVLKKEEASKPNLNLSITKKLFYGQMSLSQPISKAQSFSIFKSEDAIILSQDDSLFKNDKFQIISAPEKIISQPVNIIQSVLQNGYQHSLKTLDSGWLERVARKTGTTIENPNLTIPASQHCLTNALNANFNAPVLKVINTETEATKIDYDSEDIIDDSDEDTPCSQITSLHIVKKKRIENISEKNLNTHLGSKSFNNIHSVSENHVIPCSTQEVNLKGEEPIANETVTDKCINTNIESIDTNAAEEISPRRSSRQTRVKVSLQEFPSEEEDAFHTDTDEKDPEFILESEKSNDIFEQEIEKNEGRNH
ncbi:hypothetical protein NQ314_014160 [Rhamnusium bicolor]|uniref:Uncharacterized protein n=1 Tax=Rhamnusium bicolor TaxID=1586634 RepID=A0AAV8X385_9CUCU|nr:hypothetical protein NQ314_014160 [Rhamnusium bicolor]